MSIEPLHLEFIPVELLPISAFVAGIGYFFANQQVMRRRPRRA